ncbi:high-affinity branched-chain amino acid ABC transporter ATP-binding protein LivG [Malaciobacter molluscorum LMG 25693]|uniref:High-affinity branched-chain amino acid ABC transporter ATP-binding protein LivG n=1 Tax=Malaciobacter molluscorum LMG 25693 TaxID=870501 RepID=A0A2G1DLC2_9BACT|nr:ABC transporter ATP-binding protein [Malaciobacter molluscorum]AXX92084.1 high-affinity branched-chain amino acid ABC transporter, ATP-binding protein [Malaciobacter molluscorum LMG 25693]PHO19313.1 high-affinity branched-chain amino acid ABC transporter ATP-binding protein LivG [Malaciobacter molluscorum LMG 25693]RXJ96426.1 high-affinity branched-chain amino acid ABC transporter ATP-binding protein LivG [Malaciobacter molluscorum]
MILEVCNITKKFGGVTAIKDTSFNVKSKEIYGLIGPNGAGKTTMFNIITGNYSPTEGMIKFDGKRIDGTKPHKIVHKGIARTFQNIRLFKSMTVLDNILIAFDYQANYTYLETILRFPRFFKEEKRIKQKSFEIMEVLGISKYANEQATSLSYGNQRKVEIARALAASPKLLLLDEPAAGMNPNETQELAQLLFDIRDKFDITILLIEHDMKFVNHLCDRVMVLDYGKTIFEGHIEDAIKDKEVIKAYLGDFKHA